MYHLPTVRLNREEKEKPGRRVVCGLRAVLFARFGRSDTIPPDEGCLLAAVVLRLLYRGLRIAFLTAAKIARTGEKTMDRRFRAAAGVVALLCAGMVAGCGDSADMATLPAPPLLRITPSRAELQPAVLEEAIDRSAAYLLRQVEPSGRFVYCVNTRPEVPPGTAYNILRHAGTIYSLCMAYESTGAKELREPIVRTCGYLLESVGPVDGAPGTLAVWSNPKTDSFSDSVDAKLGGAGLALVALLGAEAITPGTVSPEVVQQLGQFVLYMQRRDGSFYSKYTPTKFGRDDSWHSLYYPGEAALGLVMLSEFDGDLRWREACVSALEFLARSRQGRETVPADHWALLATERLLTRGPELPPSTRTLLEDHARQICRAMLAEQNRHEQTPAHGSFDASGRTTPAATRLEGLLATLAWLPAEDRLRPELEQAVTDGMRFLLRAQVQDGEFAGGMPRVVAGAPGSTGPQGEVPVRDTEIRIDYVQHALSAMIRYRELARH